MTTTPNRTRPGDREMRSSTLAMEHPSKRVGHCCHTWALKRFLNDVDKRVSPFAFQTAAVLFFAGAAEHLGPGVQVGHSSGFRPANIVGISSLTVG